jgi:hypothetical protein
MACSMLTDNHRQSGGSTQDRNRSGVLGWNTAAAAAAPPKAGGLLAAPPEVGEVLLLLLLVVLLPLLRRPSGPIR